MLLQLSNPRHTAQWFRALGDETRLRILERLSEGEQCVCDLTDALEAGQSLMSHHLKTLKEAGLLRDRRQGRWIYYSLDPAVIDDIREWVVRLGESAKRGRPAARCRD